jgi:hypothetical protein
MAEIGSTMSTAELYTPAPAPARNLKLYSPELICPRCWAGYPAKVAERFASPLIGVGIRMSGHVRCWISEQWWRRVNVLVPRSRENPRVLWQPPPIAKPRRRRIWRGVPQPHVHSPFPCLTCQRPFQSAEDLFDHLQAGCWSYEDIGAIPRTVDDVSAELHICRCHPRAILHGDDHARNMILVALVPLFKKVCGKDPYGDKLSIALHAAAVELEKARTDPNHPLRNGDTVVSDPRMRDTSHSLQELRELATESEEPVGNSAKRLKTTLEWLANVGKTAIRHAQQGWKEVIDGKAYWNGGDRNCGVTAVPAKKKGGKAKGKCRRRPEIIGPARDEYSHHNRHLTEAEAGVHYGEVSEWRCIGGRWHEEVTPTGILDFDSSIKFDHEHNRFSRIWDDLTVAVAVTQGILGRDEDGDHFLNVEGWINEHFTDPVERELLVLKSKRVGQEQIARQLGTTRWRVRKMLKEIELTCRRKLRLPPPAESAA